MGVWRVARGSTRPRQTVRRVTPGSLLEPPRERRGRGLQVRRGLGADGGTCSAYVEGKVKAVVGDVACASCQAFSSRPPASTQQTACLCDVGFSGPDCGECAPYDSGTLKEASGAAACESCRANSWSLPASTQQTDCLCDVGFSGPDGGACGACAAGTFKASVGSAACASCLAFSSSPPGSDAPADCLPGGLHGTRRQRVRALRRGDVQGRPRGRGVRELSRELLEPPREHATDRLLVRRCLNG
jgi:hypothetical protein